MGLRTWGSRFRVQGALMVFRRAFSATCQTSIGSSASWLCICSPTSLSQPNFTSPPPGGAKLTQNRVWDIGLKVQSSRFRVELFGFRVQGSGFRVQGSGFRVRG